jgi:hypothetical protein
LINNCQTENIDAKNNNNNNNNGDDNNNTSNNRNNESGRSDVRDDTPVRWTAPTLKGAGRTRSASAKKRRQQGQQPQNQGQPQQQQQQQQLQQRGRQQQRHTAVRMQSQSPGKGGAWRAVSGRRPVASATTAPTAQRQQICPNFLAETCVQGAKCPLSHDLRFIPLPLEEARAALRAGLGIKVGDAAPQIAAATARPPPVGPNLGRCDPHLLWISRNFPFFAN